jgi:hypothetical protein
LPEKVKAVPRLGPLASVEEADQLLVRVVDSGYPEARIVVD